MDKRIYFAMVIACATGACALDTAPDTSTEVETEPSATLVTNTFARSRGPGCQPILELGPSGKLEVKGYLCPIPHPPIPDPATPPLLTLPEDELVKASASSPLEH